MNRAGSPGSAPLTTTPNAERAATAERTAIAERAATAERTAIAERVAIAERPGHPRARSLARPRVCHLITRLILGGAQRIALETAAFLARNDWEVELWAGPETGPEGSLWEEARERGLSVRVVPDLRRAVSPIHDARAYAWLSRAWQAEAFDVVHTHSSKAGIVGRLAGERAGVPLRLHSVHGWAMEPATHPPASWIFTALERRAAHSCDALIAVSQAVRDAGLARGIGAAERYRVIHGAVVPGPEPTPEARRAARLEARRELGLPEDATVLGTLGRLDHAKDPLGAWQALEPLLNGDPRCWAVFIGDGPLRDRMADAVARSPSRERVRLAGFRAQGSQLLPALDLFFLASRWEGFPLAVLEAMAAGLPVVSYAVAGVGEAVIDGETGFLAPRGERDLWRRRVKELAEDGALRGALGARGRRLVLERFSLESMLARTLALYETLRAGKSRGEAPVA